MSKRTDQQVVEDHVLARDTNIKQASTIKGKPKRCWTAQDDAFIKLHCKTMTDSEMATALDRSQGAASKRRLDALQIPKSTTPARWTAENNEMLRALYGQVDTAFLAAVLFCPEKRMRQQARRLGLKTSHHWSHEEDEILKKNFPISKFIELLPRRGLYSVYRRADTLSLSRGLPYLLSNWSHSKFHMYPPELKSLIRLHNQVKRRLQDVQAQH